MSEERILGKLDQIDEQNRQVLVALTQIQEQVKALPDHEARMRALENWRYGTTASFVTAIAAMGTAAWTSMKGA